MKNESKATTKTVAAQPIKVDPIEVAKRKLDEARIDYKRIKEINAGPKRAMGTDPSPKINSARAEIYAQLKAVKETRSMAAADIKAAKQVITEKRIVLKEMSAKKQMLKASIKSTPRAPKSQAVKVAQVALLEAELAYRKACIG